MAGYLSHCCIGLDTSDSSRSINPTWIKWSRVWSAIQASFLDSLDTNTLTALNQISSWRSRSLGSLTHHSGSEEYEARCFNYEEVSQLWTKGTATNPTWDEDQYPSGLLDVSNWLTLSPSTVAGLPRTKRVGWAWKGGMLGISWWWEECDIQWYDDLTFICVCSRLSLWATPDTSVSNITQRPGSFVILFNMITNFNNKITPLSQHFMV